MTRQVHQQLLLSSMQQGNCTPRDMGTHLRRTASRLLIAPGSPLAAQVDGQKLPPHPACACHIWQQFADEALRHRKPYDKAAVAAGY